MKGPNEGKRAASRLLSLRSLARGLECCLTATTPVNSEIAPAGTGRARETTVWSRGRPRKRDEAARLPARFPCAALEYDFDPPL